MQWPLQPHRYPPYGVRCNGLVLFFLFVVEIWSRAGIAARRYQPYAPKLQWFGPFFICSRNLELSRVDISSLPLAAFHRPIAQSSSLYRSVTSSG